MILVSCRENEDNSLVRVLTAVPPSGSQVTSYTTITLTFSHPVNLVNGAIGFGKKWAITPPQATMNIIWTNSDGTRGYEILTYKLK